jgi:hypothetical protein
MKDAKVFWSVAVAWLLLGAVALAQLPTATITGTIRDTSGAVVPGVSLTATNEETGIARSITSGSAGTYRFAALPVGTYTIRAEQSGFQTQVRTGLRVTVGQDAVLNFTLEVGAVTETVSVTAEAPIVDTTSGTLSSLVSEETVSDLPLNGRNFNDLTLLQTGISAARTIAVDGSLDGLQFSSGGAPIRSNSFMMDGTIINNLTNSGGSSANENSLGVESIREYRVLQNSYSAEYGMSMGAQVSMVTKSGSNDFHGSLFEYFRNSSLDAANWADNRAESEKPALRKNSYGGSLGGPIMPQKAFFFVSYEGVRERRGSTLIGTVPTAAGRQGDLGSLGTVEMVAEAAKPYLELFPLPNGEDLGDGRGEYSNAVSNAVDEDYGQVRIDYTLGASDTLFGRYTVDDPRASYPAIIDPGARIASGRNTYFTISENHIFSPALLNTFTASYVRTGNNRLQVGVDPAGLNFIPGKAMGSLGITGLSEPGQSFPDLNVKLTRFSFGDDIFYTLGRHSLKFGTLIAKSRNFVLVTTNGNGAWSFASLRTFLTATPRQFTAITPGSRTDRTYDYTMLGFYIQDDIQVMPTFTLNLGLRYEFHTSYEEIRGLGYAVRDLHNDDTATPGPPFENPSLKNFSPRLGFAWDVRGDGKTALRGGFGLLYDLATIGSSFIVGATATPPISTQTVVRPPGLVFGPLPNISGTPGNALRTIDYHMEQPHLVSYNLNVERELPFEMGLTLAYAGSRGLNLIKSVEGNPTTPGGLPQNGVCVAPATPPTFNPAGPKCWLGGEPRANPSWANVEFKTAGGNSWYNSLQFGLRKRLSQGVQFQSSYTWSKVVDETQGQFQGPETLGGIGDDPANPRHDRGRAEFDIRHQWRFNALYRFPSNQTGAMGRILNGWWTGTIFTWTSGVPFAPELSTQRSRSAVQGASGGGKRPDLVSGIDAEDITRGTSAGCNGVAPGTELGTPERFYDPCAFAIQPLGFLGNASRGIISGPNFSTLDFSLVKDTALPMLGESAGIQFRAEIFNILNHPSFGIPDRTVYTGSASSEPALSDAGRITSTFSESREIQFALKFIF